MISIVMPAYNAASFLRQTVHSLLDGAAGDIEIVICNDGSEDDTLTIANALAGEHECIKVVSQSNRGAAAARNRAFSEAIGEWILYFDADDLMAKGAIAHIATMAGSIDASSGSVAIYWSWAKFRVVPSVLERPSASLYGSYGGWQWVREAFATNYPTFVGSILLPRALIDRIGGWDESLTVQDDMEFFARLLCAVQEVHYCADALFLYRQSAPNSLSQAIGRTSFESRAQATLLAAGYLVAMNDELQTRQAAARQLMQVAYVHYLNAPDLSGMMQRRAYCLVGVTAGDVPLPGGRLRRVLQSIFGWRIALHIHRVWRMMTQ